ncbi:hypothetical protein TWF694_003729 [Orbilia ellipsospora]|uniref:Uncharacterized protein n=1 Tax=Orbilia ellipsospora TaxID=2528407 RepID=A0AAV9X0B0_9PEZI
MPRILLPMIPENKEPDESKDWGVIAPPTKSLPKESENNLKNGIECTPDISGLMLEERPSSPLEERDFAEYWVDLNKKFSAVFKFELAQSRQESIRHHLDKLPVFTEETAIVLKNFKRSMADPDNKSGNQGHICRNGARATSGRILSYISQIKMDTDILCQVILMCWEFERILRIDLSRKLVKLSSLKLLDRQENLRRLITDSLETEYLNSCNRMWLLNIIYEHDLSDIWMDTQRMNRLVRAIGAIEREYGWWERERDLVKYPEQADELRILMEAQKACEKANARADKSRLDDIKFERLEESTRNSRQSALDSKAYAQYRKIVGILNTGSN